VWKKTMQPLGEHITAALLARLLTDEQKSQILALLTDEIAPIHSSYWKSEPTKRSPEYG